MVEGIQYEGGISIRYLVQMCHTISMEEVHHQYSRGSWWLYLYGKMIFYRQYNSDFICPTVTNQDVPEILLGC